jgi:hypothetical protein
LSSIGDPPAEFEATAFLQRVDFEIGRILRQILERGLYRELGFEGRPLFRRPQGRNPYAEGGQGCAGRGWTRTVTTCEE